MIRKLIKILATFDIFGSQGSKTLQEIRKRSDAEAIAQDWQKVGDCIRYAIGEQNDINN